MNLKEELDKPFPTQPLNPSVNTEFKYEAWKRYKARKDEVYLLRRQIIDKRLGKKKNNSTEEEDAEYMKFEQEEIAKHEKEGRRISSRAIRNKYDKMKKAEQDEIRRKQILKREEAERKEREERKRQLALQREQMKLEQQRERERYREAASRKRDQDKVLKLDRRIATLKERQLRKHQNLINLS